MGVDELPDCVSCWDGAGYPCRTSDGEYDFDGVAEYAVRPSDDDKGLTLGGCIFDVGCEHPNLLPRLIEAALGRVRTPEHASYLAAGLIENALTKHGAFIIECLETLASRNAKVQYVLSGVWGKNDIDPAVWDRLCRAVGTGPRMDDDPRTPRIGELGPVLTSDDAERLLAPPEDG